MPHTDQQKIAKHYANWARNYDRRWAHYSEGALSVTIEMLALQGTERLLDVACGTGELERRLVRTFPQMPVEGIDLSEDMLAAACSKLADYPSMHFAKGDSRHLDFPDQHFDIVVTCSAFHYMRSPQEVLQEFARVTKPGGRVLIVDWCRDYLMAKLYNSLRKLLVPAHHQVYTIAELQQMLHTAGLTPTRVRTFAVQPYWRMMCVEARRPV